MGSVGAGEARALSAAVQLSVAQRKGLVWSMLEAMNEAGALTERCWRAFALALAQREGIPVSIECAAAQAPRIVVLPDTEEG